MQHIVLFELEALGHRMVFVRYIVEAMARRDDMRMTFITSPRGVTPWVEEARARFGDRLALIIIDIPTYPTERSVLPPKVHRQFVCSGHLRRTVSQLRERESVEHVLIPFFDDYSLFPFAWRRRPFGDVPWSGIAIRPRFHLAGEGGKVPRRREDAIEAWAYKRLVGDPTLSNLFSIDPYFALAFTDKRMTAIFDPADIQDVRPDANLLPVPREAVVLLVYGSIDQRKGLDRLLAAAADPRVPSSLVIALIGAQDPSVASTLSCPVAQKLREQERLVEVPRHVSDAEEASVFSRADVVWSFYPGSYCSSGAMVRGGAMGRPLLTTDEGLTGLLARNFEFGLTASEFDQDALVRQMTRLALDEPLRRSLGQAGKRYFADHTGAAFGDLIMRTIAGQAGAAGHAGA